MTAFSKPFGDKLYFGWYVVWACCLCMFISAGIGWFTFPVFVKPFEKEFGWSRTEIMIAVGIWAIVTGVSSPILGHLVDKRGGRWIILGGVVGGGLCCMALAEIQSLVHLYPVLFIVAIATAASTYMPVASVVSQWFIDRRGLAMSLAMVGMAVGGFVMPNLASFLIEGTGWRWTYRIFGLILLLVLTPVVALWIHRPQDVGCQPYHNNGQREQHSDNPGKTSPTEGFNARQALTMPGLWGIGIADLLNGMAYVGIMVNMVAFSIDAGIDRSVAAFAYSAINAVALAAMVAVGMAADKFNKRILISVSYGIPAIGVLFLFDFQSPAPLFAYALLAGLCSAAHATLWPLVVNDCFGDRAFATIMGILSAFYVVGTAIGPPLAGYIYDTTASYNLGFVLFIGAFLISGASMAIGAKAKKKP